METAEIYPARNPFPYQGTLRLAGQRLDGSMPNLAGDFRTVFRRPIGKLERFLSDYLGRFQPEWSGDGGSAFVRGRHGSGKTHTIFATWMKFAAGNRVFPVYTCAQDADFLNVYTQFTGRLTLPLLIELSGGLFAEMAAEELIAKLPPTAPGPYKEAASQKEQNEVRRGLKANPQRVKRLIASYAVEEGAANARQRGALTDLTQGNSDLARAVQCLQGDQFAADAADWLCRRPVTAEKMEAMGIAYPIDTPQKAAAAIELLAAFFAAINRPLVLFIDQAEKLTDVKSTSGAMNAGILRSLIDAFESRNAALVLAGTQEGWDCLPEDARQRIGLNVIDSEFLTLAEALDIIGLYVTPLHEEFVPGAGKLFPFTEDAVREIVRLSAGNPRKLLQYCHVMFLRASPAQAIIDAEMVNSTAQSELANQFFDRESVKQETRRILGRQPFGLRQEYTVAGMRFDFALMENQRAIAVVNVSDAVFGRDEAANALLAADTVTRLRKAGETAAFILVVTGYVSPEVTGPLAQVVNELIVFAPEEFETRLDKVLQRVRSATPAAPPREEAVRALSQIGTQRIDESRVVEQRAEQVSDTHEERRYSERREAARRDWSERRAQLEKEIAKARADRASAAFAALDKERTSANRRRWMLDAIFALSGIALISIGLSVSMPQAQVPIWIVSGACMLVVASWELVLLFWRPDWIQKSLSAGELVQAAKQNDSLARLTFVRNPTMRFLFHAKSSYPFMFSQHATELLTSEPLSTLRLAYAHLLIDRFRGLGREHIVEAAQEAALLAEDVEVANQLADAQPPLDLLTALYGSVDQNPRLAYELCAAASVDPPKRYAPAADALARGLDRYNLRSLAFITERQIRSALRELSPFEQNGLGAYDFLSKIGDIDQAFLFCSQLLLYLERDLLGDPASAPSPASAPNTFPNVSSAPNAPIAPPPILKL